MKKLSRFVAVTAALAGLAGLSSAQSLISAKSGMVHYVEGRVLLDGRPAEVKFGVFPSVNVNSELRTEDGRAEILLTPGVFLRLGENSGVRMVSNRLEDTKVEVLGGSALVECVELPKYNAITLIYKDAALSLKKDGVYRIDTEPPMLRVYSGEADIRQGTQRLVAGKGKQVALDNTLVATKFDSKVGDALLRWAGRRSEYLAMANVSAAKSIRDAGSAWEMSGWRWNPYFGMFTFVPMRGTFGSFWGYRYWSPASVMYVYNPRPAPSAGGWESGRSAWNPGYSSMGPTAAGSSGTMAASPAPTAAASAPSAPVSSGSGHAGGRGK